MPQPSHLPQTPRALPFLVLLAASLILPACSAQDSPRRIATSGAGGGAGGGAAGPIVIDGNIADWPEAVAATSDEHYIYLRVSVPDNMTTLQSSTESLVAWIDLDGDPATGLQPGTAGELGTLGVDLAVEFSPRSDRGPGRGVRMTTYTNQGQARGLNHTEMELHFAPTYASEWTEMRIARRSDLVPAIGGNTTARGVFAIFDAAGTLSGWSDVFTIDLPAGSPPPPREAELPARTDEAVRVVSWNFLLDKPSKEPEPFARVLKALDPDIVLIQEWSEPGEVIAAWFNKWLPAPEGQPDRVWTVRDSAAWGVAVASHHPIEALGPDALEPRGRGRSPTRFVGALVLTPLGDVATGSLHLKCCGSAESEEDQTRIAEAMLINDVFAKAMQASSPNALRVIGGDVNLVGTRKPLEALRSGLDSNNQPLTVLQARVLGDSIYATWEESESAFSAGRLDYLLVGTHLAEIKNSFVIDTTRMSDATLASWKLERGDTGASDHNPVVVDIKPAD